MTPFLHSQIYRPLATLIIIIDLASQNKYHQDTLSWIINFPLAAPAANSRGYGASWRIHMNQRPDTIVLPWLNIFFISALTCLTVLLIYPFTAKGEAISPNQADSLRKPERFQVLAFNDLGMHCYDRDFSVFSLLPPFNVIHAQVLRKGRNPRLLSDNRVELFYSAVEDVGGSINSTSVAKSNFWDHSFDLFGITLAEDQGILGAMMPGLDNTLQPLDEFNPDFRWFTAAGIPITAIDDSGLNNEYPMMRITAKNKLSGETLAETDIVLPVSAEMNCSECHADGGIAADDQAALRNGVAEWSDQSNFEIQYRENILILHDARHSTALMATTPVLCAACHYSPALDLGGTGPQGDQIGHSLLSFAIHGRHGRTIDNTSPDNDTPAIIPEDSTTSCYQCHPGSNTKCLRGAMANAGLSCQDCHGGLMAVAGAYADRMPWLDEPKCQSCHTGDAVNNHDGSIRRTVAYEVDDLSATPIIAANKRFAEQDDTLYRNSLGHGGLACSSCHGSTHAIWPSLEPNDNVAAEQIQGHAGTIIECVACHGRQLGLTTKGPHGMHNVNDPRWNANHEEFYERNPQSCQACHGINLEGTVLSRTAAQRRLKTKENGRIFVPQGTMVSCNMCHKMPD